MLIAIMNLLARLTLRGLFPAATPKRSQVNVDTSRKKARDGFKPSHDAVSARVMICHDKCGLNALIHFIILMGFPMKMHMGERVFPGGGGQNAQAMWIDAMLFHGASRFKEAIHAAIVNRPSANLALILEPNYC